MPSLPKGLVRDIVGAVLLLSSLAMTWSVGTRSATDSPWTILAVLLALLAAAAPYIVRPSVVGRPVSPAALRGIRAGFVAPLLLLVLVTLVRELARSDGAGAGLATALAGSLLCLQSGDSEAPESGPGWQVAAALTLGVGALWGLVETVRLVAGGGWLAGSGMAFYLAIAVGTAVWVLALCAWFVVALLSRQTAGWAAAMAFGLLLLAAMFVVSGGSDSAFGEASGTIVGGQFTVILAGIVLASAEPVYRMMQPRQAGATLWLTLASGVLALCAAVYAYVLVTTALVLLQGYGDNGKLVWALIVGLVGLVGSVVCRSMLRNTPAQGRRATVVWAGVLFLMGVITLAVLGGRSDLVSQASPVVVPAILVLMMTVPASMRRLGPLLSAPRMSPPPAPTLPEPSPPASPPL